MNKIIAFLSVLFLTISTVSAQLEEPVLRDILNFINKDSLKRTVQDLQDFESRFCGQTIGHNRKVAQYLVDRLKNYGVENAQIDSFFVTYNGWAGSYAQHMYNVVGTLEGSGNTDSTVIIGAHLDAVSYPGNWPAVVLDEIVPGADDNATGCAVMIEMARVMHKYKLKPRHNIDFMAYDAEEIGLLGARYDAAKRYYANENIIVMLNNDMVGHQPENEKWYVTLRTYDNSSDVTEKAVEAFNQYTTVTPVISNIINSSASDSYAYYIHNFKANFPIEYHFSPYYHKENDLVEYLNFEYCRQIARMNFVLLDYYAELQLTEGFDRIPTQLIEAFPNPTKDIIWVRNYSQVTISKIEVYDITGRLLSSINDIQQQQNKIILNKYSKGIYFVRIYSNIGIVNKKIIKN